MKKLYPKSVKYMKWYIILNIKHVELNYNYMLIVIICYIVKMIYYVANIYLILNSIKSCSEKRKLWRSYSKKSVLRANIILLQAKKKISNDSSIFSNKIRKKSNDIRKKRAWLGFFWHITWKKLQAKKEVDFRVLRGSCQ